MNDLLDSVRKKGGRVTKSNSEDPKLVILGEFHNSYESSNINPKILFTELKPEYFFCESVNSGEELDRESYLELVERFRKINDVPYYRERSFEAIIFEYLKKISCNEKGYIEKAVNEWFSENPKTIFVGIDSPGAKKRNDNIFEFGSDVIQNLDDYLVIMLHEHGDKLTVEEYKKCEELREWLYKRQDYYLSAYEMRIFLNKIRKRFPQEILHKANVQNEFRNIEKHLYIFNKDREKMMGNTMAEYTAKSTKSNLSLTGSYHIRPASFVFQILEGKNIPYVAIDITKG